ncbi:serine hydrolase domain-containing protein [Microbulbifer sp. S227A]|uniref:serine hydrolase domain-containing protein n=1 Tax=Microbulbifer sp. S227A TaxID=3415131 RepID=UPI003C7CF3CC
MQTIKPRDAGFDGDRLDRIAAWMDRYVGERKYPGSSVLIARGGKEVYFNATGRRNITADLPFERDTVARIYSMTKPVTTVAAMTLVEQGLFHLDAPVSDFLPAFSDMTALVPGAERLDQIEPCASPTIHQLMTHTSGLSYPFNPGVLSREMDEQKIMFGPNQGKLADMADRLGDLPLAFRPGSRWEYSVGIDVLGRVIEVATGQSLDRFMADTILEPLGMHETRFVVPDGTGDRFASLYTPLAGSAMDLNAAQKGADTLRLTDEHGTSPFETAEMHSGGGGLVGTIDDYMAFVEMLRRGGVCEGGHILSPRTVAFMMRNHLPGDIASMGPQSFAEQPMEGMGFGLGGSVVLEPGRVRSPGNVGDFSWGGMASTFFWIDPVLDLSVVFFTQLSPSSSYPARPQLKALVHGALTG